MDGSMPLSIYRHISILKRFPHIQHISTLEKKQGQWIIFGRQIDAELLAQIQAYTSADFYVLDGWKVASQDVLLMSGYLDPSLAQVIHKFGIECASIEHLPDLSKPGLMVMDMDSTAIEIECIDEIAELAGVGDAVREVTERAMQGELDFEQSLRTRVAQLQGADESVLTQVRDQLPLTQDLKALIQTLKAFGWKSVLASGGFTYFSSYVEETVGFDESYANELAINQGQLTGEVVGEIVSAQTKADILVTQADEWDIEPHNTIAVGDGANDLIMMGAAGMGIAFHAKPKVAQQAQASIRYSSLVGVMCILSASLVKQQRISWQKKPVFNS
ncbi:MAG: phosphoserine phosphatase [Vibrio sp.]